MTPREAPWYEEWIPPWWRDDEPIQEQDWYPALREAFVEENGYYITLPEFEDIIHIRKPPQISEEVYNEWNRARIEGRPANIHPAQNDYLNLKRRRFESILASPQPGWMQKIGSVMTWIDDTEDALSTGVLIARMALKIVPRVACRFVPILGWALLATDVLSIGSILWKMGTGGRMAVRDGKRQVYNTHSNNPFSRKAKIARAARLAKKLPAVGETIEALQTLDNVAGVGVCFGPIVGCLNDILAGAVRSAGGLAVTFRLPGMDVDPATKRIMRALTGSSDLWNGSPEWDDELYQTALIAYGIGMNTIAHMDIDIGTAYDEIDDWTDYEVEGRRPWKPETIWMLEDEGINIEQSIGWPTTGERWISYGERAEQTLRSFQPKFEAWALRNTRSHEAYMANQFMIQGTETFLERGEGRENVHYELTDEAALIMNTFHNNFYPDPETPIEKIVRWVSRCKTYKSEVGTLPPTRYQKWMGEQEGIVWSNSLPPLNVGVAAAMWPEFGQSAAPIPRKPQ